jgi:hypothetical protein
LIRFLTEGMACKSSLLHLSAPPPQLTPHDVIGFGGLFARLTDSVVHFLRVFGVY